MKIAVSRPCGIALLGLCFVHSMAHTQTAGANGDLKNEIQTRALNKSSLKNVQVSVEDDVAVLTGSVDVFASKEEADKRVHRVKGVKAVRNEITVTGPAIADSELQAKLIKAISYDRVGYGTTAFNAIGVKVSNGEVMLTGHAYGPVDASSAVAVAENTPGVKDVSDEIEVDPVSSIDDQIRIAVFRSVYGFPSLNKYAIDPAKPIRISVQNGNVTLYGLVDNRVDRDTANIRANGVPGVFKVTNDLEVRESTAKD